MQNIAEKIRKFPDWQHRVLKTHYKDDTTRFFFAKTLSYILLSSGATMVLFNIYFLTASPQYFSTMTKIVLLPVYIIPIFAFASAYSYLIKGQYKIARNIFTTVTILAIISSIALTGGFFTSIATPFLVVVPVVVFLLYGMRAGAYIAVAVPIYLVLQTAIMKYAGLNFPDFTSQANPDMNTITTNMALYMLVLAMVASYEHQRNNLRREVNLEREKLAGLANSDPLTGLSNTRHFYAVLAKHQSTKSETSNKLAILYLDLNNFKSINDTFGHQTGDKVLINIADKIRKCVAADDIVTRMGGDEFVILICNDFDQKEIEKIRSKLFDAVCAPVSISNTTHYVGVSIGQCIYPDDTSDISAMLQLADQKMYKDKNRQLAQRIRNEVTALPHLNESKSA